MVESPINQSDGTREFETPSRATPATKLAVAVGRDPNRSGRARVIAQARGALAETVCALAARHKIPLEDDRDLAALLSAVELDHDVPLAAVGVIAGLLTELYHASRGAKGGQP